MKKNIVVFIGLFVFVFFFATNNIFAYGCGKAGQWEAGDSAGEKIIKVEGSNKTFKGTLYQSVFYWKNSCNQQNTNCSCSKDIYKVNRILVDQTTATDILNALSGGGEPAKCNGKLCTHVIGCVLKEELKGSVTTFQKGTRSNIITKINFDMWKATSSSYLDNEQSTATYKIGSTSPNYIENNTSMNDEYGSKYKDKDLFWINYNFSVRALANAVGAEIKWENDTVILSNPDLFKNKLQYCSNV